MTSMGAEFLRMWFYFLQVIPTILILNLATRARLTVVLARTPVVDRAC